MKKIDLEESLYLAIDRLLTDAECFGHSREESLNELLEDLSIDKKEWDKIETSRRNKYEISRME